ncbi:beta-ketoacyl synthase N-terminal-like domain-containing protein [Aliikangiella coralliicola]|uniref:Carrier domain-containing protein n=1 Tax=Aliikangiella coralliicola TaxID=2592383 RepID=A0A545U932_9GAMM|nr:beta-ketoacyl synthase N-terminal-like domain-containing protein [Aliikangiella coralliicola]TQV85982.1 hypothetical protein FLL46_18905 [Aliikangiella coralliicola]
MQAVAEFEVLGEVKKIVESTLKMPLGKLDVDAEFESFGMDSIITMELMTNLSKKFDLSITPAQFTEVNTVNELASTIQRNLDDIADTVFVEETSSAQEAVSISQNTKQLKIKNGSSQNRQLTRQQSYRSEHRKGKTHRPVFAENQFDVQNSRPTFKKLLGYIKKTYSIDLTYRAFDSLDEIVSFLITEHLDELISHYQLSEEFEVNANLVEETQVSQADVLNDQRQSSQKLFDIAIVGLSCHFPDAPDARTFWNNLVTEKNSIREIPKSRWDWEEHYAQAPTPGKTVTKWGALIEDVDCFDPSFFNLSADEAKVLDPQERLLLQQVYLGLEDAGIDAGRLRGSNTGVFIGYEYAEYEQYLRDHAGQIANAPLFNSSSPTYYLANRLSYLFDFCGPSESINTNCASSAVAINRAYYSLLNQESEVAVAGGVCLNLFVNDYITGSQYGMLSPDGTCGVFDDNANGFTRGEGVGVVILKRLADAERDNNPIYGVIKACHQNNRGGANDLSEIKHEAITRVIGDCYDKAGINPETIDYIEVDGYSTKWGDSFEFEGIKNVFKGQKPGHKHCALGSVKGNIGHLEPASGIASVIKVALSLKHRRFPATITKRQVSDFIDIKQKSHPLYIADREIEFEGIRGEQDRLIRAGVNSFADSGANVHIVLEEYVTSKQNNHLQPETAAVNQAQLFILSAKDRARLADYVDRYIDFLSAESGVVFEDLIYSLQTGREAMTERLAVIATSVDDLLEKLNFVKGSGLLSKSGENSGLKERDIYYGSLEQIRNNPLVNLITKDMSAQQIELSMIAQQWQQIALLWTCGATIPWAVIWREQKVTPVSLPGYPFAKEKYSVGAATTPQPEFLLSQKQPVSNDQPTVSAAKQKYLAPRNHTEKQLVAIWSEILDQDPDMIGINDDFLELGGDSNSAMKLISMIKAQFGRLLPLDILFTASTIATLAKEILSEKSDSFDILVPIQTEGDRRPIFAVPGVEGYTLPLRPLSHGLGEQQPFYGLQAIGFDGETQPVDNVEEIAKANIEALKEVQAEGPYTLLGYSNGGIVAFEMARLLQHGGDKVADLILLDTLEPGQQTNDQASEILRVCNSIESVYGLNFNVDIEHLRQLPEEQHGQYLYEIMTRNGLDIPQNQFNILFSVAMASERACRHYKTQKLPHKTEFSLYRASEESLGQLEDYGWGQYSSEPIHIFDIKASHFSIVDDGPAKQIAQNILRPGD